MSNLTLYDEPRPEMDEMLGQYFQAQMPKPWPAFKAPKAVRTRATPTLWSRFGGRIALAACVALLIAGYWSLSGDMAGQSANQLEKVGPPTASKVKGGNNTPNLNEPLLPNGPNPKVK